MLFFVRRLPAQWPGVVLLVLPNLHGRGLEKLRKATTLG
jgi:hypothetical protein